MKKIINLLFICLLIAGIIVIATIGFNVGLDYRSVSQIAISVGEEYKVSDVKNIVNQVYKENKVQQVEIYKDLIQVSVYGQTDAENTELINKLNEFYGTELTIEKDVTVTTQANLHLRDLVRPYIIPVWITLVIVAIYFMVVYRAQGPWSILFRYLQYTIGSVALYISILAVSRIPISAYSIPLGLMVYACAIITSGFLFEKGKEVKKEKE